MSLHHRYKVYRIKKEVILRNETIIKNNLNKEIYNHFYKQELYKKN